MGARTVSEGLAALHAMNDEHAHAAFLRCCGSDAFARAMTEARPFASVQAVHAHADAVWAEASASDIMQALAAHPMIGEDIVALRERFANTAGWAASEQGAVMHATADVLDELRVLNRRYRETFGYIFVVCATGKTAEEMLALLQARLEHSSQRELAVAAAEQLKITHLRLDKLLSDAPSTAGTT